MGLLDRLFKREKQVTAGSEEKPSAALQVVFNHGGPLDAEALTRSLRAYHRSMAKAAIELMPETFAQGTPYGHVSWGRHQVLMVGFYQPMPPEVLQKCLQPAHYDQERKQAAYASKSHMLLYYRGRERDVLEQYVALAMVAGAFKDHGAVAVLNETAHTAVPIDVLGADNSPDMQEVLREFPLLLLYAGFVKCEVDGVAGVWMRTYGCSEFGIPDLAIHVPSHDYGEMTFETFSNITLYLRTSKAHLKPGQTMQIEASEYLKFRAATAQEPFLEQDTPLLVMERIRADQINR